MGIFLSYVFLGLSLSAPMGPINAAQLEKVLGVGFSRLDSWHRSLTCRCYLHGTYLFRCNSFPRKRYYKTFLMVFRRFCFNLYRHRKFKNANQISISNTRNDDSIIKSFFWFLCLYRIH